MKYDLKDLFNIKNKMFKMRSGFMGIMIIAIIMSSYGVEAMTRCEECQVIMNLGERYLESPNVQQSIEEYVCKIAPVTYRGSCFAFMDKTFPSAISYIENKYTPVEICETLKACSNSTHLIKPVVWYYNY